MEPLVYSNKIEIKYFYIHIPFCIKKCSYCSFYSVKYDKLLAEEYIQKLKLEIDFYKKSYDFKPETIYFGGGTPSLFPINYLDDIIKYINHESVNEITIEINPFNLKDNYINDLQEIGINRFSFGVQSMLNRELNLLGRLHIADDVYKLYNTQLQNQDLNFSYDIIYGLPNQTLTDIQYTLEELLKISPKHFSVYCLSLENNVPLYKDFSDIPEDALVEEMYFYIRKTLLEYGYNHYELSSFSLSNFESQHNTAYWSDKYYLGLGAGSSGYLPNIRYSNIADLEKYLSSSIETIQTITELSKQDNETDYIITGLRKCKGIIMKEVNDKFNINFLDKYAQQVDKLYKQKLIIIDGDHIRINPESYFISNEVLCEFV